MVAVPGLPVTFQMTARSIRPPSSGRPGSRLKTPTMMLATMSCLISAPVTPYGATWDRPQPSAPSASDSAGPAPATANSRPGVGASRSISETPPSGYSRMRRTGRPKPRATIEWDSSCTSTET